MTTLTASTRRQHCVGPQLPLTILVVESCGIEAARAYARTTKKVTASQSSAWPAVGSE